LGFQARTALESGAPLCELETNPRDEEDGTKRQDESKTEKSGK
jgi:hypothetical protein